MKWIKVFSRPSGMILIVALFSLIRGMFFLCATPPWQAADEVTHFEAAVLYSRNFPRVRGLDSDPILQRQILESMAENNFYAYLNMPTPLETPSGFRDAPYLEAAPSKLGRPPLYYWVIGILSCHSGDVLFSLFAARFINLLFSILGIVLVGKTAGILFPRKPLPTLFAMLPVVWNPGFLHLGASVTQESWTLLISAFGFWTVASTQTQGLPRRNFLLYLIWLLSAVLTRWTLAAFMLPLAIAGSVSPLTRKKMAHPFANALIVAAILSLVLFTFWTFTGKSLLFHEVKQAASGFRLFLKDPLFPFIQHGKLLFQTFWAGFGWLTVPTPNIAVICFLCVTGFIFSGGVFARFQSADATRRVIDLCFAFIGMTIIFAGARASGQAAAVQGRYLFPAIPALGILSGAAVSEFGFPRRSIRVLGTAFLFLLFVGDSVATMGGWFYAFHWKPAAVKPARTALENIKILNGQLNGAFLDIGSPAAAEFMEGNWYAPESAPQVWFRNSAELTLPLLPEENLILKINAIPFLPPGSKSLPMDVHMNQRLIQTVNLVEGLNVYQLNVPEQLVNPGINRLHFACARAAAPFEYGLSNDRRVISAGIDTVTIDTAYSLKNALQKNLLGYWTADGPQLQLFLPAEAGIRLIHSIPFTISLRLRSGEKVLLSNANPIFVPDQRMEISRIAIRWGVVSGFQQIRIALSTGTRFPPGRLSFPGLHLLLFLMYWGTSGLAFMLGEKYLACL